MHINGQNFHTIWVDKNEKSTIYVIDQTKLPFEFKFKKLLTFDDAFQSITDMIVRGAPLIGVTAAYGIYLATLHYTHEIDWLEYLYLKCEKMKTARPTAINLAFAVNIMFDRLKNEPFNNNTITFAFDQANKLKQLEIDNCQKIGEHGVKLIEAIAATKPGKPVNILTHCNAGWLACIDWGTATAPIYLAHQSGIPVHVWVDETRPRNQGSKLTAFELLNEGVPHTVIPDNTGGHLMQHGMVDLVIVGSDRTTKQGDVCNKIGTYLKALAAADNAIPFYVALPTSSIDMNVTDGITEIPIEERNSEEVKYAEGKTGKTQLIPDGSPVANYGFDVTPARLVTALITENGVFKATDFLEKNGDARSSN